MQDLISKHTFALEVLKSPHNDHVESNSFNLAL